MAKMDWPLPGAFDPDGETEQVLAEAKSRLSKNFKWSKAQCLYDAGALAVLLHVFRRDDEALEICRALGQIPFDGKYTLWSAVETALTFQARLVRQRGESAEAAECVRRVRAAGLAPDRLKGILIDRNDTVKEAVRGGKKKTERAGRLTMAKELALIIELGGSTECPVDQLERDWDANLARLRELTGAP